MTFQEQLDAEAAKQGEGNGKASLTPISQSEYDSRHPSESVSLVSKPDFNTTLDTHIPTATAQTAEPVPAKLTLPVSPTYGYRYATPEETNTIKDNISGGMIPMPDDVETASDESSLPLPASNFAPDPITGQLQLDPSKPWMVYGKLDEKASTPSDLVAVALHGFTRSTNEGAAGVVKASKAVVELNDYLDSLTPDLLGGREGRRKVTQDFQQTLDGLAGYFEKNAKEWSGQEARTTPEKIAQSFGEGLSYLARFAVLKQVGVTGAPALATVFGGPAYGETVVEAEQAGMSHPAAQTLGVVSGVFNMFASKLMKVFPPAAKWMETEGNSIVESAVKKFAHTGNTLEIMQAGNKVISAVANQLPMDSATATNVLNAIVADIIPTAVTALGMFPIDAFNSVGTARRVNRMVQTGEKVGMKPGQTMALLSKSGVVDVTPTKNGTQIKFDPAAGQSGVLHASEEDKAIQEGVKKSAEAYKKAIAEGKTEQFALDLASDMMRQHVEENLDEDIKAKNETNDLVTKLMFEMRAMPELTTASKNQVSAVLDTIMTKVTQIHPEWKDWQLKTAREVLWRFAVSRVNRADKNFDAMFSGVKVEGGRPEEVGAEILTSQTKGNLPPEYFAKETEYRDGLHLLGPAFLLQPSLSSFKLNIPLDGKQILGRLASAIPPVEMDVYKQAGLEKFLEEKRTPKQVADWMQENGPRIELWSYGQQEERSPQLERHAELTHTFLDTLSTLMKREFYDFNDGTLDANDLLNKGWDSSTIKLAEEYKKLLLPTDILKGRSSKPRATSYYNTVSPFDTKKYPVKRVDVVIPRGRTPFSAEELQRHPEWEGSSSVDDIMWQQDNLHENLPNTLGWAMVQYVPDPKTGEKVAYVAEVQSRWGQENRNRQETLWKENVEERDGGFYIKGGDLITRRFETKEGAKKFLQENGPGYERSINHPLLRDYNQLILKSVIAQVRKDRISKVVVSDAVSAMLTQGHDIVDTYTDVKDTPENRQKLQGYARIQNGAANGWMRLIGITKTPEAVGIPKEQIQYNNQKIIQAEGMYLNYDKILPKIMEDLTGQKGEWVEVGEHKNAYEGNERTDSVSKTVATEQEAKQLANTIHNAEITKTNDGWLVTGTKKAQNLRQNLIFKNPDGTPKTTASGTLYDISQVKPNLSLFGKDKANSGSFLASSQEGTIHGAIRFLDSANSIINLFPTASLETLIHEFTHEFSKYWTPEEISMISQWTGTPAEAISKWQQSPELGRAANEAKPEHLRLSAEEDAQVQFALEEFAGAFASRFVKSKVAPVPALQGLFTKMSDWLSELYSVYIDGKRQPESATRVRIMEQQGTTLQINPVVHKVMQDMLVDQYERRGEFGELYNHVTGKSWEVYKQGKSLVVFTQDDAGLWKRVDIKSYMNARKASKEQRELFGPHAVWLSPSQLYSEGRLSDPRVNFEAMMTSVHRKSMGQLKQLAEDHGFPVDPKLDRAHLADFLSASLQAEYEFSVADRPFYGGQKELVYRDALRRLSKAYKAIQDAETPEQKAAAKQERKVAFKQLLSKAARQNAEDVLAKHEASKHKGLAKFLNELTEKEITEHFYVLSKRAPKWGEVYHAAHQSFINRYNQIRGLLDSDWTAWDKAWNPMWKHANGSKGLNPRSAAYRAELTDLQSPVYFKKGERVAQYDSEVVTELTKWQAIKLGLIPPAEVSPVQRSIMDNFQRLHDFGGELNETGKIKGTKVGDGGIMSYSPQGETPDPIDKKKKYKGQILPFKANPHSHLKIFTPYFFDIMTNPKMEHVRNILAQEIAHLNSRDVTSVLNYFEVKRQLNRYGKQSAIKKSAMEFINSIKVMPTSIWIKIDGVRTRVDLQETDPINYMRSYVESLAAQYAFKSSFAPFDSQLGRYQTQTIQKPGFDPVFLRTMKQVRKSYMKEDPTASGRTFVEGWIRAMNRLPVVDTDMSEPGSEAELAKSVLRAANRLMVAGALSGYSFVADVADLGQQFRSFGIKNSLKDFIQVYNPSWLQTSTFKARLGEAAKLGGRGHLTHRAIIDNRHPVGSAVEMLANVIASVKTYSSHRQEAFAAIGAMKMVDDMRGVGGGKPLFLYRETLRSFGYTPTQVEDMMSGTASEELYASVIRRAPAVIVGTNHAPSEVPWSAHSEGRKALFTFWRYYQNFAVNLKKLTEDLKDDKAKGELWSGPAIQAVWRQATGTVLVGGVVGGLLRAVLISLTRRDEDELRVIGNKFEHPIQNWDLWTKWVGIQGLNQMLWGPLINVGDSLFGLGGEASDKEILRNTLGISMPASVLMDTWHYIAGKGNYSGLSEGERTVKYLTSHVALANNIKMVVGGWYLGNDNQFAVAQREYYKALDAMRVPRYYGGYLNSPEDSAKFAADMKKITRLIGQGKYADNPDRIDQIHTLWGEVRGLKDEKAIKQSLRSQLMLNRFSYKEDASAAVNKQNMEYLLELKRRLSPAHFQALINHDNVLMQMISGM